MDAGTSPVHQPRAKHRHELRTLTYVTFDQANGGIVRNLTNNGVGAQVVAAVHPKQQLRVRFELRYPRLQVETRAEVVWATLSGQCGIRFLDMPPALQQQINQWIFGNLLEGVSLHTEHSELIFAPNNSRPLLAEEKADANATKPSAAEEAAEEDDGLMVSATPVQIIALPVQQEPPEAVGQEDEVQGDEIVDVPPSPSDDLAWLTQPLTGRALAWTVDVLVVVASLLLFTLVFLSVTREAPPWPLAGVAGAALVMAGMYWGFFRIVGGGSFGTKLARIAEAEAQSNGDETRFR